MRHPVVVRTQVPGFALTQCAVQFGPKQAAHSRMHYASVSTQYIIGVNHGGWGDESPQNYGGG